MRMRRSARRADQHAQPALAKLEKRVLVRRAIADVHGTPLRPSLASVRKIERTARPLCQSTAGRSSMIRKSACVASWLDAKRAKHESESVRASRPLVSRAARQIAHGPGRCAGKNPRAPSYTRLVSEASVACEGSRAAP